MLCVKGTWNDGTLTWSAAAPLEGTNPEAARLLNLYEEGNLQAQGGDLPKALAIYQRGISGFIAVDNPDAHLKMAQAALLWGLGTASDRADRDQTGWRTLLQVLSPGKERDQLPLGLALNWSHSTVIAGYRHDHYREVAAVLTALQRLGWGDTLPQDQAEIVKERFELLSPFLEQSFEGLMQEERYQEAAALAKSAHQAQSESDPDDSEMLDFWSRLQEAAAEEKSGFRLDEYFPQDEVDPETIAEMPAVRLRWSGEGPLAWKLGKPPEDPNRSALVRLYVEAGQHAQKGELDKAGALYERALQAYDELKEPKSSDAFVRAMMLFDKAALQDRSGSPQQAWQTLLMLAHPKLGISLPLPMIVNWARQSAIVAATLGRYDEVSSLMTFLMQLSIHPRLGQVDPELHQAVTSSFMYLLEGAYGGLEDKPEQAIAWLRSLQKRVEPEGLMLLPLREVLYHALAQAGEKVQAEAVANEVLSWARQEGDEETAKEWESKLKS